MVKIMVHKNSIGIKMIGGGMHLVVRNNLLQAYTIVDEKLFLRTKIRTNCLKGDSIGIIKRVVLYRKKILYSMIA